MGEQILELESEEREVMGTKKRWTGIAGRPNVRPALGISINLLGNK